MSDKIKGPAPAPCGSCPYRLDVPSGVWSEEEYEKLPPYDTSTGEQPPAVFCCHQQPDRLCAGWVGVHDMRHNLGLRLADAMGAMEDPGEIDATLDYETPTPLFASGAEAAAHGLAEIDEPGERAVKTVKKLEPKLKRRRPG